MSPRIAIDEARLGEFCTRWKVRELSLFGSVLRDDFRPDSDVDVLVSIDDEAAWSLMEWVQMESELTATFGGPVDLVGAEAIRNPFRRRSILATKQVIHAV